MSLFGITMAMAQTSPPTNPGFDLNERGLAAAKRGDQATAERLYRQAADEWRKMGPDYIAHLGITEHNLGQSLCAQGRRTEGLSVLEDALKLLRDSLGVRHIHTISAMNFVAGLRMMNGDTAGAEVLFREALPIERELFPKDDQLSLTLGGLSSVLIRQNKATEALPMAEESLTLAIAADGEQSLPTALAYANVAAVHKFAKRYERALPLYRKALSIYQNLVGPEHPRTAGILTEIGLIEMEEGNYTLAERDMRHSLDIVQRSTAWAFEEWVGESNLGMLLYRESKYDEAARCFVRSLSVQERAGVHGGSDMASTLEALAKVRDKQRRYQDAKQLRDRAVVVSSFR